MFVAATLNTKAQYNYTYISQGFSPPFNTRAEAISGTNIAGYWYSYTADNYESLLFNTISQTYGGAGGPWPYGISGNYVVGGVPTGGGFLYNIASQTYTTLPFIASGISGDEIVGGDTLSNFVTGTYTTLNVPGTAWSISGNNIAGYYYNSNGNNWDGFVYNITSQTYITLADPNGYIYTYAYGISGNNVVGDYFNGSSWQGYIYNITSQTYTTLDVPGANDTYLQGIDGSNIVGYYDNSYGTFGFLATPVPEPSVWAWIVLGSTGFLARRWRWPIAPGVWAARRSISVRSKNSLIRTLAG